MELLTSYIPIDRQFALAQGENLPDRMHGAALFADISGFTPLTEALAREFGPQRGAEELTIHLNRVYDALIEEVHRYRGSVISFSGDAITCWFDQGFGPPSHRALASALAQQRVMGSLASIALPSGATVTLAMKAAVSAGSTRRFLVGDPQIQLIDTLAGAMLDRLASAEHQANKGETLVDQAAYTFLEKDTSLVKWREDELGGRFAVLSELRAEVNEDPWPDLAPGAISESQARPWLLPPVYQRLQSGQGEFLAELRPAVSFFLRYSGIDYEGDQDSGMKLDSFVRHVQQVVNRYEGALIQLTIGDKGSYLQAAFGAPIAHEDEPARALSAALDLLVPPYDYIRTVQIGISKGRMRTGAYGSLSRRTYGMMSDDVNLAARLMQSAQPGQILVNRNVFQGISEDFIREELPDLRVKGKTEPIKVYGLQGHRQKSAILLQEPRYSLPMVGRRAELDLAASKLETALDGHGQLVGISGVAGIGKSRLIAELIRLANSRNMMGLSGECQSYGTNTSYLVWQNIWRQFFGLDPASSTPDQISHLEKKLTHLDPSLVSRLPLLGSVLNLPIPDNDLTRSFDAKLRKASLEALLAGCLRARGRGGPILIILDDCQWIDPLSEDLLDVLGRSSLGSPVLIVLAYRPPLTAEVPPLRVSQLAHFTEIRLAEFSDPEAAELIGLKLHQNFNQATDPRSGLVELITSRAQGNPFYIEELLNLLRDQGGDINDSQTLAKLELPTSLHSLVLSRIDQLTESQKITLKVASVIGRLFKAAMLWGTYPQLGESEKIVSDLNTLIHQDLMALEQPEPELVYFFKHILTQEVAYESLPFATRAILHDQIGKYIERAYAQDLEQNVDLLAYHFDHSQNTDKKREYLLKAGEAAQKKYANSAAISYYQRVLPLLPKEEQISTLLSLGKVLELVGQWTEAGSNFEQALKLSTQLNDNQAWAWSRSAQGELLMKQGLYNEAGDHLLQAQDAFEKIDDRAGVGQSLHLSGTLAAQQGDYESARLLYEQSLAIRRQLGDKNRLASLTSNLGILASFAGDYRAARNLHEEALAIRRELGDRWSIANSLNNLGVVLEALDQIGEARGRLEEALAILRQVGDPWAIANALNNLGNVARTQGDYQAARSLYLESIQVYQEYGDKRALAYLLEDLGGLAALQGQAERALRLIGAAASLRLEIGSPLSDTEQSALGRFMDEASQNMDEITQAGLFGEGRSLNLEEAIQYALQNEAS
jgi:predicted ATPase/class 3 adenylate cyclase